MREKKKKMELNELWWTVSWFLSIINCSIWGFPIDAAYDSTLLGDQAVFAAVLYTCRRFEGLYCLRKFGYY